MLRPPIFAVAILVLLSCAAAVGLASSAATPPATDSPASGPAAAASARAVALHQAGDLDGAVRAYGEAIGLDARNPQLRSNLGAALSALGRYAEAIAAYRDALRLAPGDARIRTNLALAYYKSADIPAAARELQAVHDAQPQELRATLLLADCRLQLGEYDRVEALLRPLEAARADDRTVQYVLGMALIRGGKPAEGQRLVEALMRGGDSAEAQYLLGSASFMAKDYPKAVEHLSKALAEQPALPGLRSYYGQALLFTGDADGAEAAFRAALREAPNDYDAAFYLASILAQRRQADEARPLVERALQLRPQSEEARALRARLAGPAPVAAPAADDSPLVGHAAPDVELLLPGGGRQRLSQLRGRPVLLAFGSFTCPQFRHGAPVLNDLYARYGQRVVFRLVYIREAHPEGEWQSTINARQGVAMPEARSAAERAQHAALCRERLSIPYDAVVDDVDGAGEKAFAAFPSRAFVLDRAGSVTFSTALDEESLRPDALAAALDAVSR